MNRVAVFIDGNDFYQGLIRNNENPSVDYYKFGKGLCSTRQLLRIYYYNESPKLDEKLDENERLEKFQRQQKFYDALRRTKYVTVKTEKSADKVNALLAVDILRFAITNVYDTAILVSSNGAFVPAVEAVKDLGKNIELAYFNDGADALRSESDMNKELNTEVLSKCIYQK